MNTNNQNGITPKQAEDNILNAYALLTAARNSRHIIFTSPSPSSTESAAKRHIMHAINDLDAAIGLMRI